MYTKKLHNLGAAQAVPLLGAVALLVILTQTANAQYYDPGYVSREHDWHSGTHHDWHSAPHYGPHSGLHWDPNYGWHYGRHSGPHAGPHHDLHRGPHHSWYGGGFDR
jgi:hypothetical protein